MTKKAKETTAEEQEEIIKDQTTVEDENQQEEASADAETEEESPEEPEAKEPSWEDKYNEVNDRYLRLYSEFENFRRRNAKERLELVKTANGDLMGTLLPVLDDLERGIASNENSDDIEAIKEGFSLVYNKFKNLLAGRGLKEMDVKGEKFDADVHDALTKIPAPSEDLKGKVVDVIEKGYSLNDKVLRYSKVVVGE